MTERGRTDNQNPALVVEVVAAEGAAVEAAVAEAVVVEAEAEEEEVVETEEEVEVETEDSLQDRIFWWWFDLRY